MIAKKKNPVQPAAQTAPLPWQMVMFAALLLLLARMAYVQWFSPYGLGPDEAQYWHWTRHLDWSYLTKPPLTTAAMWASTQVWGETALGVKFFALLGQSLTALLAFAMAGSLAGAGAAWLAFALFATLPMVAVGGLLMSPDALLLPLWMTALYLLMRETIRPTPTWRNWLAIGILIGLAGLAKYTAALFFPLLGLWMLLERRDWFKTPHVYVAGLIALAFQTPVLIWNMNNDWAGLHHLLWQTDGGGDTRHGGLATLGDFLLGQALVLGPITFIFLVFVWATGLKSWKHMAPPMRLLLLFTLPIFAAFLLQTLNAKVQPNWPLLGTVPAFVIVAVAFSGYWKNLRPVLLVGIVLNAALSLILHDTFLLRHAGLNTPYKSDPTKDLRGWPELGLMVGSLAAQLQNPVVLSTRYQTTAQLAFHNPLKTETLYLNDGTRRSNQYDLWPWPALDNRLVLYVNEHNHLPEAVKTRFGQCEPWKTLEVETQGIPTRKAHTWLCWTTLQG